MKVLSFKNGFIVFKLLIGVGMIVFGLFHKPKPDQKIKPNQTMFCDETADTVKKEKLFNEYPCYNGAAGWMFKAGILELVATSFAAFLAAYEWWAHRDGVIDSGERCILSLSIITEYLLVIVELADIIWGSIIVFGKFKTWTHKCWVFNENVKNGIESNYCPRRVMLFCFIFLIIRWVILFLVSLKVSFKCGRKYEKGDPLVNCMCCPEGSFTVEAERMFTRRVVLARAAHSAPQHH